MFLIYGWTAEQFAYVKARHKRITGDDLPESIESLCELQDWWRKQGWSDPLETKFAGVSVDLDSVWVARSMFKRRSNDFRVTPLISF